MPLVKTSEVTLSRRSAQRSKYQDDLDLLKSLKPDQVVTIPIPEGIDRIHSQLGDLMTRYAPVPPKGYRWTKNCGEHEGKRVVVISLIEADAPGRVANFAFGAENAPKKGEKKVTKKKPAAKKKAAKKKVTRKTTKKKTVRKKPPVKKGAARKKVAKKNTKRK